MYPSHRQSGFTGTWDGTAKEPDFALYASGTGHSVTDILKQKKDFPYIVTEIGFSETISQLRNDVAKWLLGSDGEVRTVVAIVVDEGVHLPSFPVRIEDGNFIYKGKPSDKYKVPANFGIDTYLFKGMEHLGYRIVGELTIKCECWRLPTSKEVKKRMKSNHPIKYFEETLFERGKTPIEKIEVTRYALGFAKEGDSSEAETVVVDLAGLARHLHDGMMRLSISRMREWSKDGRTRKRNIGKYNFSVNKRPSRS